jgi:phosphatidylglycerophosphate synthase
MTDDPAMTRRPIRSRSSRWASAVASALARRRITPNSISVASVVFSLAAALAFAATARVDSSWMRAILYLTAIPLVVLRLLANLFDGMVAVEGGLRGPSGEVYNELPDRLSDALIFVGAGYGASAWPWAPAMGWAAAVAALMTAYVRALGASVGSGQDFSGPMAKPQRMWLVMAGGLIASGEAIAGLPARAMPIALAAIAAGAFLTTARRSIRLIRKLESR